jgi:hypothetical protein
MARATTISKGQLAKNCFCLSWQWLQNFCPTQLLLTFSSVLQLTVYKKKLTNKSKHQNIPKEESLVCVFQTMECDVPFRADKQAQWT